MALFFKMRVANFRSAPEASDGAAQPSHAAATHHSPLLAVGGATTGFPAKTVAEPCSDS